MKAKFESGSSYLSFKRSDPGAINVGLIGGTCTALPGERGRGRAARGERLREVDAEVAGGARGVAAQVGFESKIGRRFIIFRVQTLKPSMVNLGSIWGQPAAPYRGRRRESLEVTGVRAVAHVGDGAEV